MKVVLERIAGRHAGVLDIRNRSVAKENLSSSAHFVGLDQGVSSQQITVPLANIPSNSSSCVFIHLLASIPSSQAYPINRASHVPIPLLLTLIALHMIVHINVLLIIQPMGCFSMCGTSHRPPTLSPHRRIN